MFSTSASYVMPGFSSGQSGRQYDVVSHLRQQLIRLVLDGTQTHTYLKKVVLSSLASDFKGQRGVKGYFDVAMVSLLEDGLLVRCGSGNWARYAVPGDMVAKAQGVAYQGFEGECEDVVGGVGGIGGVGATMGGTMGGTMGTVGTVGTVGPNGKRELSLSPLRVTGGHRGIKKRKRRSFCSSVPMSP